MRSAYPRIPRYVSGVPDAPEIIIRNAHGAVAGRISRAEDGSVTAVVIDEESRWLVELAAERAGAPARPRPRPSCSPPER
ncbi:MAG: hypothetical protein ACKORG_04085 [Actinomycetota bacterium]